MKIPEPPLRQIGSRDKNERQQRWSSGGFSYFEHSPLYLAKLPNLELPTFDGDDPVTFLPFMDAFGENINRVVMTDQPKWHALCPYSVVKPWTL